MCGAWPPLQPGNPGLGSGTWAQASERDLAAQSHLLAQSHPFTEPPGSPAQQPATVGGSSVTSGQWLNLSGPLPGLAGATLPPPLLYP